MQGLLKFQLFISRPSLVTPHESDVAAVTTLSKWSKSANHFLHLSAIRIAVILRGMLI